VKFPYCETVLMLIMSAIMLATSVGVYPARKFAILTECLFWFSDLLPSECQNIVFFLATNTPVLPN